MKLRCYCCGTPIRGRIALVTQGDDGDRAVDRVFVMLPEHENRVDDPQSMIVQRVKEKT